MKKLISIVLTAVLCGTMMITTPFANCYAEKQPSGENPSSSSSEKENNDEDKKDTDYPVVPLDVHAAEDDVS